MLSYDGLLWIKMDSPQNFDLGPQSILVISFEIVILTEYFFKMTEKTLLLLNHEGDHRLTDTS